MPECMVCIEVSSKYCVVLQFAVVPDVSVLAATPCMRLSH